MTRALRYAFERQRIESALKQAHDELELRVEQRTAELQSANRDLQREMLERRRAEELARKQQEELAHSLDGTITSWINFPGMDGRDVLKKIKDDEELCTIPVVALTTSSEEADVLGTYKMHANSFMTKPVEFSKFVELVKAIGTYGFTLVKLPPTDAGGE